MEIRDIIRDKMIEKRLTPAQLAESLGVTNRTVYKWMNGEMKPTYAMVYKLADFFGVDPKMFLE